MINMCGLDMKDRKVYFKLLAIGWLYVLPIIVANVRYQDDMARSLYGETGWYGDGRPLGEWLVQILCGGKPVVDLAPFPLLLSVAILSYGLFLYARKYFNFVSDDSTSVLLLATVLMNPFAMSNLSYRFDCIIMLSALSVPFMLFALPDAIGVVKTMIYSVIAGVAMMTLYQPALGMCVVLLGIHVFFCISDKRNALPGLYRVSGICIGVVFYKLVIAKRLITSQSGWQYEASKVISLRPQSISILKNNVIECCKYIKNCIWQMPELYKISLFVFFMFSIVTVLFHTFGSGGKESGCEKILKRCILCSLPFFIFAATFFPMTLLEKMKVRSRMYYCYGGFQFFLGIILLSVNRKIFYAKLLLTLLLFSQMTYMFSYGNALKCQNEYEKYLVYNIVHDIEILNGNGEYEQLSFVGQPPRARELSKMCSKYSFFNEIVPVYFSNSTWIGGAWVYHYMQYDMEITELSKYEQDYLVKAEPVLGNARYVCYVYADKIIVCFR